MDTVHRSTFETSIRAQTEEDTGGDQEKDVEFSPGEGAANNNRSSTMTSSTGIGFSQGLATGAGPASPTPANKRPSRAPRVPLGEAFRMSGLDELRVARDMAGLVDTLKARDEPKLLLDALKESSRCLEKERSGPPTVTLVHHIPRPIRKPTKEEPTGPAEGVEATKAE